MARISVQGVKLEIDRNEARMSGMGEQLKRMLKQGAEVVVRETGGALDRHVAGYQPKTRKRRTGALGKSIKPGPVSSGPDSAKVEIWPQGMRTDKNHRTPERNATIGFVTEYGARGVPARGFMADGRSESEQDVTTLWRNMLDEYHRTR